MLLLLLVGAEHVVEEVELGLGNGHHQDKSPYRRNQVAQHGVRFNLPVMTSQMGEWIEEAGGVAYR